MTTTFQKVTIGLIVCALLFSAVSLVLYNQLATDIEALEAAQVDRMEITTDVYHKVKKQVEMISQKMEVTEDIVNKMYRSNVLCAILPKYKLKK